MVAQPTLRHFFILALGWACLSQPLTSATTMRHVSQCQLCHLCHLSDSPPEGYSAEPAAAAANPASSTTSSSATAASTSSSSSSSATAGSTTSAVAAALPQHQHRHHHRRRTLTLAHGKAGGASGAAAKQTRRAKRAPAYDPELDPTVPVHFKPSSYRPRPQVEMATLPECEQCYGCRQNLTLISDSSVFLNNTYTSEMGATNSWIFRTQTNLTPSGWAVVKVYCLPVAKRVGGQLPTCNPLRISEIMRQLMAIDKLSGDCGFTDLIPRMWLAPIVGVLPSVGYPINWWGLWMEYVDGISLENFLYRGTPKRQPLEVIADVFNTRLNGSRVLRGAIFDLLTSQCDRHAQNLFLQEDGNLKLIDNESCLQHMWRNCGFDSVLVPTTQKQEIIRLANHYVLKLPSVTGGSAAPRSFADPQLLLDYRCYLPSGKETLGTDYPPQIEQCLRRIADMTPQQVFKYYGFPELRVATNLHTRATDMIVRGFEWAAKYGHPQNSRPKRYRFQPKCCSLLVNRTQFDCAHPWSPSFELPLGNSITGHAWDKDRPDPGTYLGGTFPEDGNVDMDGLNATTTAGTAAGVGVGAGAGAGRGVGAGGGAGRRRGLRSAWRGY